MHPAWHFTWCAFMCVCVCVSSFGCVQLFATLWTVAQQTPLSMGFSRQEYWSGLLCPPPGYLPDPGIESASLLSPALANGFFTTSTTWEAHDILCIKVKYVGWQYTALSYSSPNFPMFHVWFYSPIVPCLVLTVASWPTYRFSGDR